VTVFNACGTASDAAPLWLLESTVQASGISSFSTGCAPLEVDFEFTGSDAETIQWFGSGWSAEGPMVSHTWTSPSNETVLLVAYDYCGSDSLEFPVEIFGNPSFVANGMLPAVCLGDTLFLNLEAPDLTSVEWTWGNGTFASGPEAWVVYDEPGTYTPAVYAEFGSPGCSQGESWVVEVFDYPYIPAGQTSFEGCSPLEVEIDPDIDAPNWSGVWSILPSGETYEGNSFEFTFSHASAVSNDIQWIQLVASAGPGCIQSQTWPVVVYPLPEADFESNPFAGTWSEPDPLNMGWQFENQSTGAVAWEWNFGDGTLSNLESPEHTYEMAGNFDVTLSVWNADGCSTSRVETVAVLDATQIYVPNAFTPGVPMDGVNDGFKPVLSHPERFEASGSYRFEVFNRWGVRVFTTEDPQDPWLGEGPSETHFVQDDVYHWQLTLQWSKVERKIIQGSVILLRE
jgi:PKD repeat protein